MGNVESNQRCLYVRAKSNFLVDQKWWESYFTIQNCFSLYPLSPFNIRAISLLPTCSLAHYSFGQHHFLLSYYYLCLCPNISVDIITIILVGNQLLFTP